MSFNIKIGFVPDKNMSRVFLPRAFEISNFEFLQRRFWVFEFFIQAKFLLNYFYSCTNDITLQKFNCIKKLQFSLAL